MVVSGIDQAVTVVAGAAGEGGGAGLFHGCIRGADITRVVSGTFRNNEGYGRDGRGGGGSSVRVSVTAAMDAWLPMASYAMCK